MSATPIHDDLKARLSNRTACELLSFAEVTCLDAIYDLEVRLAAMTKERDESQAYLKVARAALEGQEARHKREIARMAGECEEARGIAEKWEREHALALHQTEQAVVIAEAAAKERDDAINTLRALMTNPHIDLGDLIYQVREREGEGWDGPSVKAWSDAVESAKKIIDAKGGADDA